MVGCWGRRRLCGMVSNWFWFWINQEDREEKTVPKPIWTPQKKANNSIGRLCPVTRGRRKKEEGRGDSLSVVVVVQNFDKRLERGKEGAGSKKAFDAAPAIQQG